MKLIKEHNLIITSFIDTTQQKNTEKIVLQQRGIKAKGCAVR